jgi:hypothetical protein
LSPQDPHNGNEIREVVLDFSVISSNFPSFPLPRQKPHFFKKRYDLSPLEGASGPPDKARRSKQHNHIQNHAAANQGQQPDLFAKTPENSGYPA